MTQAELTQLREIWRARVADFRASGQSGATWCAVHQIKEHQLWYWTRRFPVEVPSPSSSPNFVPIEVKNEPSEPLLVRVGAVTIEVRPGYDPRLLREVVQALATPC